ncbi:MAG TPA: chemotaxis protein CheW [Gammaproteobacteria bacterium]|nr:chemotaxis protein CheW [Gammaproteobacteria bacterium]
MKTASGKPQLLDPQLALGAYLDVMLQARPPVQEAAASPSAVAAPAEEQPVVTVPPAAERHVPAWATTRFQVQLFEVAGITLAVPLVKLKGVVPNDQGLTPLPGHSPLFLGVVPYQGVNARVVDTARFILPQDRAARLDADVAARSVHLVMIDEGRWALACNAIGEVVELEANKVKWRGANSRRAWLAGTLIDRMCALLDIDALTETLAGDLA